jgi:RNA polymerase sigma-70 factor (ECF subfamily)
MAHLEPHENEAFLELLTRHSSQLFAYIYALVQNLHDAEDLYQKTSIVLWRKFAEFESGTDFVAWACRTARLEVFNYIRIRRRDRHLFSESFLAELADDQVDRSEHLESRKSALEQCLEKLPEKDRRLIDVCYGGDGSIKQAAQRLGRPVGSVYDSLSRIRRVLFECVRRTLAMEGGV